MEVLAIKTPIFKVNESLFDFIKSHLPIFSEGDILVITSKLVALSEGGVVKIAEKEKIIHSEALKVLETPWALLALTERGWEINAGVDESNAEENLILMPQDPFLSAETLRSHLKEYFGLNNVGVIISDTKSIPLRVGTIGRMVGCAGFEPIKSYIDKEDLFGRKSRVTVSNLADSLSASAVLMMGEGNEQTPMVLIKNAPVTFINRALNDKEKQMQIPPEQDIFSYIYKQGE